MIDAGQLLAEAARGDAERRSAQAAERLVAHAGSLGLLDVAYVEVDSPLGPLLLAGTARGLVTLSYLSMQSRETVLQGLAREISPRVLEAPARLDGVRRQLEEYFEGRRRRFEVPLDWRLTRGFGRRVLRATARVEFGETTSYSKLAAKAGSARAYRAAGTALGRNPLPLVVPCHRVLHASGGLGGYAGGLGAKEKLLRLEGVL